MVNESYVNLNDHNHSVCHGNKNVANFLFKSTLLFLLIYNSQVVESVPSLTSARLSFLVAILYVAFTNMGYLSIVENSTQKEIRRLWVINFILFAYALILLCIQGFGDGETIIAGQLNLLLIDIPAIFVFQFLFNDSGELAKSVVFVSIVQCILVLSSTIFPSIADVLDSTIYNRSAYWDTSFLRASGYAVGLGCYTSTGALQLGLGMIFCVYFISKKQSSMFYMLVLCFIGIVSTMVARTSLVILLFCFLFLIFSNSKRNKFLKTFFSLSIAVLFFCIFFWAVDSVISEEFLNEYFSRVVYLKKVGLWRGFFKNYFVSETTHVPMVSVSSFLGTGIVSGYSATGEYINVDGGYRRNIFALGVLGGSVLYLGFLVTMWKTASQRLSASVRKVLFLFIFVFFLVGEFKEPFVFTGYYMVFFFLFASLSEKEEKENLIF